MGRGSGVGGGGGGDPVVQCLLMSRMHRLHFHLFVTHSHELPTPITSINQCTITRYLAVTNVTTRASPEITLNVRVVGAERGEAGQGQCRQAPCRSRRRASSQRGVPPNCHGDITDITDVGLSLE